MVYFAADVHLGAGDKSTARATEQRFVAWLESISCDAECLFLVGDIFDFWFEYRRVVPKGFVRVLGKLAEMADRGIRIHFFTGNHDMWVYDYFDKECGIEIHTAPEIMTLSGKRVFIAHGDNMNIDGQPMLKLMNTVFRSHTARWLFKWLVHPDLALKFGGWWSGKSREQHNAADEAGHGSGFGEHLTEPLVEYARNYSRDHDIDCFVFGHMHFPRDYRDGKLHTVHLGCWEKAPSYAVMDSDGTLTLKTL